MQAHVEHDEVVELIRLDPRQEEHEAIRELWKSHSIAEDNRDLPGLLATLTEDCVYTVRPGDHRWEGHEGAARFYGELLTAFPDIHFDLTGIVIGPQGVVRGGARRRDARGEVARLRADRRVPDVERGDLLPVGSASGGSSAARRSTRT